MGMSASQARFLSLTARKNNVEFQGQQINQQRTTLSNESSSYYSELCNMVVPTPPSVDDYTKVSYTFDDGALTNTVTSMLVNPDPKKQGLYSISYIQQWQDDYSIVSSSSSLVAKEGDNYKIGSSTLRKLGSLSSYNKAADPYLSSLTDDQISDLLEQEKYYMAMLNENKSGNPSSTNEWYVRYIKDTTSGTYVPYFYSNSDLTQPNIFNNDGYANINCYSIGSSTKTKEVLNQNWSRRKKIHQADISQ